MTTPTATRILTLDTIQFVVLLVVGLIGVFGQAAIIQHNLVDSYPFKVMSFPPPEFYAFVGELGFPIAICLSILVGIMAKWLPRWLTAILPVVVCPLVYWAVFEIAHLVAFAPEQLANTRNFDQYSGNLVRLEFAENTLQLLGLGGLIGFTVGVLVTKLPRFGRPKLP
jgi:hypothetical protein